MCIWRMECEELNKFEYILSIGWKGVEIFLRVYFYMNLWWCDKCLVILEIM